VVWSRPTREAGFMEETVMGIDETRLEAVLDRAVVA
jgi:hypothetical protein